MTDDFDWIWQDNEIETTRQPDTRAIKFASKLRMITALKKEAAAAILTELPASGESLHIVSNGKFDYFSFVSVVLSLLPQTYSVHFYGSTWTMSRNNVTELFELFDSGKLGSLNMLTGTYFKRRESSVYATLLTGIQERQQRYIAFENHAKIMLFNHQDTYIVIEGSANFTANSRLEQTVIVNNRDLWAFHKAWMDEMLNGK